MSEKREFPILNGKLLSDLDLNGHKLLGEGGGGSSVEVVPPDNSAVEGQAADAKDTYEVIEAIYDHISDIEAENIKLSDRVDLKADKLINPPEGVVYPKEVHLQNGGFYLIGVNSSDNCNAYLPNVDSYESQTFIVYCRDGTSSRFEDPLGRDIITNLSDMIITGGTANLRLIGFPTKRYVSVTMRRIKTDSGEEMIHLEVA